MTRNEITTKSSESFLDNQFDSTFRFATGPVGHTLVAGFEITRETSDPNRTTYTGVPSTSLLVPNPQQAFAGIPTNTSRIDATADSYAFYVLDTLKLNPQWDLIGGMRWDRFAANVVQSVAPTTTFNQIDEKPSWRVALVYKPVRDGSFYAASGTSFNPSAEALALTAGTLNLPPESTQSYEVGTKWDLFAENLSVRGALFRLEKANAREPSANPAFSGQNVLAGNLAVNGFELEAMGHITEPWQVIASYTYLDSAVVSGGSSTVVVGQPLANAPQNTVAFWSTYQLPWWHIQIGGGVNYVSSRLASNTPDANGFLHRAPDYYTVSAMAKMPVTDQVSLQVNAYNITNEYFYDAIHPSHVVPGGGPTVLFSTSFKF